MDKLFQPFSRGRGQTGQEGLGLSIASETTQARDGILTFTPISRQTKFTFRMPLA